MKNLISFTFIAFLFSSSLATANEILMREVNAESIETEHQATEVFWKDENRQKNHAFFERTGGDAFSLRELNLRSVELWKGMATCIGETNSNALARALLNLENSCPSLHNPIADLNRNYVEFLLSAEFIPHRSRIASARSYGRVPLHPLLQQFSFNYYIQVVSSMQFEDQALDQGNIQKILRMDLQSHVLRRQGLRLQQANYEAAVKEYVKDNSFWGSLVKGANARSLARGRSGSGEKIEDILASHKQRIQDLDTYSAYRESFDRFLLNNFILTIQNLISQESSGTCTGIGLYEYANLSGLLVHELTASAGISLVFEEHLQQLIASACKDRIQNKMSNWQNAKKQRTADPLPEAIAISKWSQKFPL